MGGQQRRLATAYVTSNITFLSCDSGRLLKVIENNCTNRRLFLGLQLWSAPSRQSSNALCKMDETAPNLHSSLAGPTFAARVGTVWTGRLLPLVSAIPQLNLEGLGLLSLTTDAYASLRVDIPGDCIGARC